MNWYYAEGGKQIGPLPESEIDALARAGKILPDTLVWRAGLPNWRRYAEIRAAAEGAVPGNAAPAPPPALSPEAAPQSPEWYYEEAGKPAGPVTEAELAALVASARVPSSARVWKAGLANWLPYTQARSGASAIPAGPHEVVCQECRQVFSREQTIQYGTVSVCPACKPMFLQKLGQSSHPGLPGKMDYAGFWIRFAAKLLDGLIAAPITVPLQIMFFFATQNAPLGKTIVLNIASFLIGSTISVLYNGLFVGKFGATPGKMICSLKVVSPEGLPLTYGRAFGRGLAEILSSLTCLIGYIIAAFDDEKRSLHDRLADTRVVYKS